MAGTNNQRHLPAKYRQRIQLLVLSRPASNPPSTHVINEHSGSRKITKDPKEQHLDYDRQVKSASTELFNDVRVESTIQYGRYLLNILYGNGRERVNNGDGHGTGRSIYHGRQAITSPSLTPNLTTYLDDPSALQSHSRGYDMS
ncbi:hypothetical protein N7497_003787 [Penicillium chrysogenum]|mgnify:CR=1 FL=1|jgi:hypothetical protein|nr:hypothetical protein N7497_003787 [Penicillium chrysogenum]